MFPFIQSQPTSIPFEIFSPDLGTGIRADDDIIRINLGGTTPLINAVTMDQTNGVKISINDIDAFSVKRTTSDVLKVSTKLTVNDNVDCLWLRPSGGFWAGSTTYYHLGMSLQTQLNSGTHTQPLHGINVSVRTGGSSSKTGAGNDRMAGLVFNVLHNSTGTNDELVGCVGQIGIGVPGSTVNTGAVGTAVGFQCGVIVQTTGTASVTESIGLRIISPAGFATGLRTGVNHYGIFVSDQVIDGLTNVWAIKTGTGLVDLGGGFARKQATKTAAYTITKDDYRILADGSAGAFTLTLPAASTMTNQDINIIRTGATGTITIDPDGTETISGDLTLDLTSQWDSVVITSNGTNWVRCS